MLQSFNIFILTLIQSTMHTYWIFIYKAAFGTHVRQLFNYLSNIFQLWCCFVSVKVIYILNDLSDLLNALKFLKFIWLSTSITGFAYKLFSGRKLLCYLLNYYAYFIFDIYYANCWIIMLSLFIDILTWAKYFTY